jgi:hypothetical protein
MFRFAGQSGSGPLMSNVRPIHSTMIHHYRNAVLAILLFAISLFCRAAEEWEFLLVEPSNAIAIREVKQLGDNVISFSMLSGYLPEGRELGVTKVVGSLTRHFFYMCDQPMAILTHSFYRDVEGVEFATQSHQPTLQINVNEETSLKRATRFICGDKSAKLYIEPSAKRPTPTDLLTLVCKFEGEKDDLVFQISEKEQTVNGIQSMFSDAMISFSRETTGGVYVIRINRYSGRFTAEKPKTGMTLSGACMTQQKKQF